MRHAVDELDLSDLKPWKAPPAPRATDAVFWEYVERWEAASWNRPGAEKAWVDRLHEDWATLTASVVHDRPAATGRARLFRALNQARVRYLVIGVGGADLHAEKYRARFHTNDLDLFLPPDAANLVACWLACEDAGLSLVCDGDSLDSPRDLWLARRVVSSRSLTTARDEGVVPIDLTLVMGSLDFEDVWLRRGPGYLDGVAVDLARMSDIVASKREANRAKDSAFLEQNRAVIERILEGEGPPDTRP